MNKAIIHDTFIQNACVHDARVYDACMHDAISKMHICDHWSLIYVWCVYVYMILNPDAYILDPYTSGNDAHMHDAYIYDHGPWSFAWM